jgi:hypothetical protein
MKRIGFEFGCTSSIGERDPKQVGGKVLIREYERHDCNTVVATVKSPWPSAARLLL